MTCHINVEFVTSLKESQYRFEFQLKGSDQATNSIQAEDSNSIDEFTEQMVCQFFRGIMENFGVSHH
jgi:hypothetical protein